MNLAYSFINFSSFDIHKITNIYMVFHDCCSYIDNNKGKFIKNLDDAVAIKSVSAWPETHPEITKRVKWVI